MGMVGKIYRTVVPTSVRRVAWQARHNAWIAATDRHYQRNCYADLRLKLGSPQTVANAPHGKFVVDLRDRWVGRELYVKGVYEPTECEVLSRLIRPGDSVLDVGANIGILTVLASQLTGPDGQVVSIEPDPYNHQLLQRNVNINNCKNVSLCQVAAGSEAGEATLFRSETNFGDHRLYADDSSGSRGKTVVPVVRLDNLYEQNGWSFPSFIKIDVQGFELSAVRGFSKAFEANHSMSVLTEYWPHGMSNAGGNAADFLGFLRGHNFKPFIPQHDGDLLSIEWHDIDSQLPPFRRDVPDSSYINLLLKR